MTAADLASTSNAGAASTSAIKSSMMFDVSALKEAAATSSATSAWAKSRSIMRSILLILGNASMFAVALALHSRARYDYSLGLQTSPYVPDTPKHQGLSLGSWNLQAISGLPGQTFDTKNFRSRYMFSPKSDFGLGVDVYVLASGVDIHNQELRGHTDNVCAFPGMDPKPRGTDSHGTAVAAVIGGANDGVAPGVRIHGVKLTDFGTEKHWTRDPAYRAMQKIRQRHEAAKKQPGFKAGVIHISYGSGGPHPELEDALRELTRSGIHAVAAAGNKGKDACGISPARTGDLNGTTITVGSIDSSLKIAGHSNRGHCVDLYAPGVDITIPNLEGGYDSSNGTSFTALHVAGLVAYFATLKPELAQDPKAMKENILSRAIKIHPLDSEPYLVAHNGEGYRATVK